MRKQLGRKILGTVLAGAMAVSALATADVASAAGAATTGEGKVYAPKDIVDVIVPTKFQIAMNPLMVDIKANTTNDQAFGLAGKTQILSGTYAIENRSTIPVNMKVDFTVTPGAKAKGDTAANVIKEDEKGATSTTPLFSLDMITTAAKSAQKPTVEPGEKTGTDDFWADAAMSNNIKITKNSSEAMKITEDATGKAATKMTTNFMLAAGPYTAVYKADTDTVEYEAPKTAAFDTVAFTFTGTTTTKMDLWAAETKGPSVAAVYTLTKSTKAAYNSTGFSPIWKSVPLAATDAKVTVTKTADSTGNNTSTAAGTVELDATAAAAVADGTKVAATIESLQPDAKKLSKKVSDIGTVADTGTAEAPVYTFTINAVDFTNLQLTAGEDIAKGYYNVTIGKTSFIVLIK